MGNLPDSADPEFEPGSFRDRNGRVFYKEDSVYRTLSTEALAEWNFISRTKFFSRFMSEGKIVYTEEMEMPEEWVGSGNWAGVLRHGKIPFLSYPYEWPFGMLKEAALLQVELLLAALEEGAILKDSSAFNFQWNGASPVFIDVLSFRKLVPGEPWIGYRQFCQMFLYPLFVQAYKDIAFHPWLRGAIDGVDVENCNRMMSARDLLRPGVFLHVYLQSKLQHRYGGSQKDIKSELQSAGFSTEMIRQNVSRLGKMIGQLTWRREKSEWSDYGCENSYELRDQQQKVAFVREAVHSARWKLVWDLGCNTGAFSRIAAENASYVVSTDADHLSVERFYQELQKERNRMILPLVMNLADASPSLGWRERERKSLTQRGRPELVLCLALIHHMVISANIPLHEFIDWLSSLSAALIIEFPTKEDPMVKRLLRNKDDQYLDYELPYFEQCLTNSFDVIKRERLTQGTRVLYFAKARRR